MKHWIAWAALVWFVMATVVWVGGLLGTVLVVSAVVFVAAYWPDWRAL